MQDLEQKREELLNLSKSEVMKIAKRLSVKRYDGKNLLKKEAIVDNIIIYYSNNDVEEEKENTEVDETVRLQRKQKYIESVQKGTLVAFKTPNGKVKSAMVIRRSTKRRALKVETKYNREFIISFDDVIWVRTGTRWPRGVYQLLKGVDESVKEQDK